MRGIFLLLLFSVLAACGGGASDVTSGAASAVAVASGAAQLSLTLQNEAGQVSTTVYANSIAPLIVHLSDAKGLPLSNRVVKLGVTTSSLGKISPDTVLTDASGRAQSQLITNDSTGADAINASIEIEGKSYSTAFNYSVRSLNFALSALKLDLTTLSAGGSAGVSLTLSNSETGQALEMPVSVSFSSPCAEAGKALLSSPVLAIINTVNGVKTATASTTYQDKSCAGSDEITATATLGGVSRSTKASLSVLAAAAGNIEFVSAVPDLISLPGIGGNTSAVLLFKVKDLQGAALGGQWVDFALNTNVGGISLVQSAGQSQPGTGLVQAVVNAGSVSTVVRVTATLRGTSPLISSQSNALTISTGLPHQNGFSLSADVSNPEFYSVDGNSIVLTARASDRFGNPVPDGSAVSFMTESGIGTITPRCTMVSGACSVTLLSSGNRQKLVGAGRMTVLAQMVGEESFNDLNGNGVFDTGESWSDQGEAFLNADETAHAAPLALLAVDGSAYVEPFVDFNGDGVYNAPDGQYNGVLRAASIPASVAKTINVSSRGLIVWSGSSLGSNVLTYPMSPSKLCAAGSLISQFAFATRDGNGNVLPAKTQVDLEITQTVLVDILGNAINNPAQLSGLTSFAIPSTIVASQFNGTVSAVACPIPADAQLVVKVKFPSGVETSQSVPLN
ncbi:hypothetical protein [Janthinobacterium sp. B9-8]|uniref:hypothetical protein n=1 Tax=Janthinobacterium sp. B9-8 TaxID=1236179 RepID=UPI00061D1A4B|nr:hypothetical protein [Janthinobacterium sp. B9-8]AMC33966.1 hypothetical protein VN23_04800 [Janthinobacterium sp. B9-8]